MPILNQSGKTLLFNEKMQWVENDGCDDFEIPMGCVDGVTVFELVETFKIN